MKIIITIIISLNCFQNCCLRKHKSAKTQCQWSQRCVAYEVKFRFHSSHPSPKLVKKMNEKKRLGYGFKALSNGIGGGGRGGEGGLALRIANIFVVLIMNEKRNECSESCRQANFFTAEFQYGYSTLFLATALSILVRIIPGAIFFNSQPAFNTLLLVLLVKSRMISPYRDIHWDLFKIDL